MMCKAIYSTLQPTYLRVPTETSEWLAIAEDFESLWNFPLCIGAVDGKHVVVESSALSGSDYHHTIHKSKLLNFRGVRAPGKPPGQLRAWAFLKFLSVIMTD